MASSKEHSISTNIMFEKVFAMKGGQGETSYASNSGLQANTIRAMLPLIKETLDKVQLNASAIPLQIVDLGCSSGTNTIYIMDVMVKHMVDRFKSNGLELPEFTAFFSDLPNNDFNTLFGMLPNNNYNDGSMENGKYFVAGVPGTFHRRLFPSRTIDFFFSSNCLHWLPQVPEDVVNKTSTAYNKGSVFVHRANKATANAYKKLWQEGLVSFLRARSQEIKKYGAMFLCCLGRPSSDPSDQGPIGQIFGGVYQDAWNDLVQEGLITSEQRDDFNLPMYVPNVQDFRDVIEADGSFSINKLELFREANALKAALGENLDPTETSRSYARFLWSVSGVIGEAYLGGSLSKELLLRMERHAKTKANELHENLQIFSIVASLYVV